MNLPLSELVEKLCIVNMKIFKLIDRQTEEIPLEEKGRVAEQLIRLNTYRSQLKVAIDGTSGPDTEKLYG